MSITFTRKEMTNKLQAVFLEPQTEVLVDILDDIRQAELQRAADTHELKKGLRELTIQVNRLAKAQTKTDQALRRLELVVEKGFTELRKEVGWSFGENPAPQWSAPLRSADSKTKVLYSSKPIPVSSERRGNSKNHQKTQKNPGNVLRSRNITCPCRRESPSHSHKSGCGRGGFDGTVQPHQSSRGS